MLHADMGESRRLAAQGLSVVGLDNNPKFLELARGAAAESKVDVEYVRGDLRELPWSGRFDAALNWYTSAGYFDDEGNARMLSAYHRALKPGGRLLLEQINRDSLIRQIPAGGSRLVALNERGDDLMIDRVSRSAADYRASSRWPCASVSSRRASAFRAIRRCPLSLSRGSDGAATRVGSAPLRGAVREHLRFNLSGPRLTRRPAPSSDYGHDRSVSFEFLGFLRLAAPRDLIAKAAERTGRDPPVIVGKETSDRPNGVQDHFLEREVQPLTLEDSVPARRLARLAQHSLDVVHQRLSVVLANVDRSGDVRSPVVRAVRVGDTRVVPRLLESATYLREECLVRAVHGAELSLRGATRRLSFA